MTEPSCDCKSCPCLDESVEIFQQEDGDWTLQAHARFRNGAFKQTIENLTDSMLDELVQAIINRRGAD